MKTGLSPHQPARLLPTLDISIEYFQCLDVSPAHHTHSYGLILNELSLNSVVCEYHIISQYLPTSSTFHM